MSPYKRLFDVIVTLLATPVWLPTMAIVSLAILIIDGWPLFYVSKRYVLKDTYRTVVKFRAMIKNAEQLANRDTVQPNLGKVLNIIIDDRLYTRTGKLLEKTHFTELPQLIQVLFGTLTLVGNRPMPKNMLASARKLYPYLDERFSIPSGITGPAQIVGREKLTDQDRLKLEITYAYISQDAYSPLLDLNLLLLTILTPFGLYKNLSTADVTDLLFRYVNPVKRPFIESKVTQYIPSLTL